MENLQSPCAPPEWLVSRFPGKHWSSLRSCKLRVDHSEGAGLDLEDSELGMSVTGVATHPGQDPLLCDGDLIVSIAGEQLAFCDNVGGRFGANFRDGAELLFVTSTELQAAVEHNSDGDPDTPVEDLANYELLRRQKSSTEYDATVRIPVGRGAAWMLDSQIMTTLQGDLGELGRKYSINAVLQLTPDGSVQYFVLSGLNTSISAARPEAMQILNFYRGRTESDAVAMQTDWYRDMLAGKSDTSAIQALPVPSHLETLCQFEYCDHTADIIVHSWGRTRAEAFAQLCVGMFNYMTPIDSIELVSAVEVEATGHDLLDLLYHLLDEFLYIFGTEMHVSRCIEIVEFDEDALRIRARGYGERMDLNKHEQGTEIKAITMHMMKILSLDKILTEDGESSRVDAGQKPKAGFAHEAYVLVDI